MAIFANGNARIHYEEYGSGHPLLLIAPGGMRSAIDFWERMPWNPIADLAEHFRVIAMDQRNAGESTAPVAGSDGWHCYTQDQLALLEHLGVDRCHLVGMCIGGSYNLALMAAAPERFSAAVMFQPIGLTDNRDAFYAMFDDWQQELSAQHPEAGADDWASFRETMYGGGLEFFTVGPDFVASCTTPMLVLMGNDLYHPESTSRRLVELAPAAELIESWKEGTDLDAARLHVLDFLSLHSNGG